MPTCHPATIPVRATEPTFLQEPISADEARSQCGISGNSSHDAWLQIAIPAARHQVEHDTEVVCYTGSHTWKFTSFPYRDWIQLPVRPVTAIGSITYVATDGDTDTWTASEYALDTAGIMPVVRLAYGESWPTVRGDMNGVTVTFTAGYSTVDAIPKQIKWAVLLALHVQWLLKMENPTEAARQQVGYDRQIELIRRMSYA